ILRCLEELHLKVIELPCNSETGIDIQQLEHIAKTFNVAACVFTSNFNNPNGVLLPDNKKKLIAAFARKHRIPVIEDDVYGDLYFGAHRPTTIKTYDRDGWVMLCASFSKTIAPGYRIGWCAPGRFLEKVTMLKATTNIASASILQLSVAELLSTGAYNRHLRRLRPILQKQVLLSSQTITKHFPAGTRLSQPEGGMVLWIELPEHISAIQLQKAALQHHINIAPGPLFSGNGSFKNYIRISCHHPWDKKVEKAIATLGNITCRMSS
ncbi:MAG TPA: PLP-dependent aminotransferase family protein, partial [Chitinophaga sp.]|uniref:aminotransferase-like domain-containing protein n=1 Tax=Chitinophaga sp. TaxID=1869181 RepID=UPI002D07B64D